MKITTLPCLAALLLPTLLPAQAAPPKPEPQREVTVTLTFPGGSLKDLLARLRGNDSNINIVASELAADIMLPQVDLVKAPLSDALGAIARIVPDSFKVRADYSPGGGGGNAVYTVSIETRRPGAESQDVRVFAIGPAIRTGADVKTVLSAIEAGARVMGQAIDMRYHEDSKLLFVKGSARQIELVREVLTNLQREQERLQKTGDQGSAPSAGEGGKEQKDR